MTLETSKRIDFSLCCCFIISSSKKTKMSKQSPTDYEEAAIFVMPRVFFKQQLALLGQFTTETLLSVVPREGLKINAYDGAQVCVIRIAINERGMEACQWNMKQPREFHIGMFVQTWTRAIDNVAARRFEFVRLVLSPKSDTALIELLEFTGNREKGIPKGISALSVDDWYIHETYCVKLGDFQTDSFRADDMEPQIMIAMPSRTLNDKINSWSKIGDVVTLAFSGAVETVAASVSNKRPKPTPDDEWPDDDSETENVARKKIKGKQAPTAQIPSEPPRFVTRKLDIVCESMTMNSVMHLRLKPLSETNLCDNSTSTGTKETWRRMDLLTVTTAPEDEELPTAEVVPVDNKEDISLISFGSATVFEAVKLLIPETNHDESPKSRITLQTKSNVRFDSLHSGIVVQERNTQLPAPPGPFSFSIKFLVKASAGAALSDVVLLGLYKKDDREFATVTFDMKERGALSTIVAARISDTD
jgi:hypothetical protein